MARLQFPSVINLDTEVFIETIHFTNPMHFIHDRISLFTTLLRAQSIPFDNLLRREVALMFEIIDDVLVEMVAPVLESVSICRIVFAEATRRVSRKFESEDDCIKRTYRPQ
jgi:hypothetical protein